MQRESQTSPRTFANDVNTSAKTTSEKYTGLSIDENRHLAALLLKIVTTLSGRDVNDIVLLEKQVSLAFLAQLKWAYESCQHTQGA
jgi:hypothetical protein